MLPLRVNMHSNRLCLFPSVISVGSARRTPQDLARLDCPHEPRSRGRKIPPARRLWVVQAQTYPQTPKTLNVERVPARPGGIGLGEIPPPLIPVMGDRWQSRIGIMGDTYFKKRYLSKWYHYGIIEAWKNLSEKLSASLKRCGTSSKR